MFFFCSWKGMAHDSEISLRILRAPRKVWVLHFNSFGINLLSCILQYSSFLDTPVIYSGVNLAVLGVYASPKLDGYTEAVFGDSSSFHAKTAAVKITKIKTKKTNNTDWTSRRQNHSEAFWSLINNRVYQDSSDE